MDNSTELLFPALDPLFAQLEMTKQIGYYFGLLTHFTFGTLLFVQMHRQNLIKEPIHLFLFLQTVCDFLFLFCTDTGALIELESIPTYLAMLFWDSLPNFLVASIAKSFWFVDLFLTVMITLAWNELFCDSRCVPVLKWLSLIFTASFCLFNLSNAVNYLLLPDYLLLPNYVLFPEYIAKQMFFWKILPSFSVAFHTIWCIIITSWRVLTVLRLPKARFSNQTLKGYKKVARFLVVRLVVMVISSASYSAEYFQKFVSTLLWNDPEPNIRNYYDPVYIWISNQVFFWTLALSPLVGGFLIRKFLMKGSGSRRKTAVQPTSTVTRTTVASIA